MALKLQKRKVSPTNARKRIFEKWDKYRSGFFSPKNPQSENEAVSDESVSRISWSSPSSSDSDLHSSEKPPRLNYLQNHRVVTKLNFDDCVTTKHKTPHKKRAKVSRLFVKREQSLPLADVETQGKGLTAVSNEIPVPIVKDFSGASNVDVVKGNRHHISPEPENDLYIQDTVVCVLQNDVEMCNEHFESKKETTDNDGIHSSPGCPRSTSKSVRNSENEPHHLHAHTMSPIIKCSGTLQGDCGSPLLGIKSARWLEDLSKETILHTTLKRESKDKKSQIKNYEVDSRYYSPDHEESLLDISVSLLSKVHSHRQKQLLVITEDEKHDVIMKENFYSTNEGIFDTYNDNVKDSVRVSKSPVLSVETKCNSRRKRMRRFSEGTSVEPLGKRPVSPVLKTKSVTTSHKKCRKYYSQKSIEETVVGPSQSPVLKRETKSLSWREFKKRKHKKKGKKNTNTSQNLNHRPNIQAPEEESPTSGENNVCKLVNPVLKLGIKTNDKIFSSKCEISAVQSESTLQLKTLMKDSFDGFKHVQPPVSVFSELKDGDTLPDGHVYAESNLITPPQEDLPPPGSNNIEDYTQKLEQDNPRNSPLLNRRLVSFTPENCDVTSADNENSSTGIQVAHDEESNFEQSEALQISFLSQNNSKFVRGSSVIETESKISPNSTFVNCKQDFPVTYGENCRHNFTADISFSTQAPESKCPSLKSENSVNFLTVSKRSSEAVSPTLSHRKQKVKMLAKCKQVKSVMNLPCIRAVRKKESGDESCQDLCNQQFPASFVNIEHTSSQEEKERSSQNMQDSQAISQLSTPMKKSKSIASSPDSLLANNIISMDLGTLKQTSEIKICMDSAKKKKRLKKNGLASRLRQLLARRKSSIRMWQYQQCLEEKRHAKYRAVQFLVVAAWTELGHTIIRCRRHLPSPDSRTCEPHEDQKTSSQEEFANVDVFVVLDGCQAVTAHLRPGSIIEIFPPWQILKVRKLNISILMCMSHFEAISIRPEKSLDAVQNGSKEVLINQEEFTCQCLTGAQNEGQLCQFRLPRNVFKLFFSEKDEVNDKCEISFSGGMSSNTKGTVAEALAGSSFLISGGIELCITVVGVFCYRHPTHTTVESDNDHKTNVIWSVLGFDRAEEYCEVVLGCSPCLKFDIPINEQHKKQQWEDFILGRAVGKTYRFIGLIIGNKVLRKKSSGLWTFLHVKKTPSFCKLFCKTNGRTPELTLSFETDVNVNDNGTLNIVTQTSNQSILYTFSPLCEEWSCTSIETKEMSILVDSFQYITNILRQVTEDVPERCSAIVKLIYIHENLFYCTDSSLNVTNSTGDGSSYVIIKVLSSCVVPQEALKGHVTTFCLLNVLLSEGKIIADKYTRILAVPGKDSDAPVFGLPFRFPANFLKTVAAQTAYIQNFTKMSKVLDLVKVSGCVIGVDEDTAFSWPTCAICGSDFLSEVDGGGFYCEKCNQETETVTSMSLEVNISCVEESEDSKVKIKLLQQSIENLLPPEPSGSEGYDVLSVLGKFIGPITCLVVNVNEVHSVKSYHLDEVMLFENM